MRRTAAAKISLLNLSLGTLQAFSVLATILLWFANVVLSKPAQFVVGSLPQIVFFLCLVAAPHAIVFYSIYWTWRRHWSRYYLGLQAGILILSGAVCGLAGVGIYPVWSSPSDFFTLLNVTVVITPIQWVIAILFCIVIGWCNRQEFSDALGRKR